MSHPFEPSKNSVTFDDLVAMLHQLLAQFPDKRTGNNTQYSVADAGFGAFSVFFTQSPSFLAFQRSMRETRGQSNAQTLFGMGQIPCDNQIRDLLDPVTPAHVLAMFATILEALRDRGYREPFRAINNNLLIPLDGTQYHSSKNIHCAQCRQTHHRNGQITDSHSVITPLIAAPGHNTVIPLEPEFITPQDGHDQQDCENAAAKRWLSQYGPRYRELEVTLLGDDLYSRQPLCEAILEQGLNFSWCANPTPTRPSTNGSMGCRAAGACTP